MYYFYAPKLSKFKAKLFMNFSNDVLQQLIVFRKDLHKHPEISKNEHATAGKILNYLKSFSSAKIVFPLGKTGLAAVFEGNEKGLTVLIRADIDALPIPETNDFEYRSEVENVAHLCGHDGHSTILAGLAQSLHSTPLKKGRAVLLFQPAEETGEGAKLVLDDPKFNGLQPDFVFALHNLPGYDLNNIIIKKQHFAAASKGMTVKLFGKTSHAAHPEMGISPALAVADIIREFSDLSLKKDGFKDFKLITIIHSQLGEIAFGTSPGYAELRATLRSFRNDDMKLLTEQAIAIVENITDKYGLEEKIKWQEEFPATVNDDKCVDLTREIAEENNFKIEQIDAPFRWSEDFGHFTMNYPGVLFGIGAGKLHPSLHNPDYDFPDEIIPTGIEMFERIVRRITEG
jgi:amidohydrolase